MSPNIRQPLADRCTLLCGRSISTIEHRNQLLTVFPSSCVCRYLGAIGQCLQSLTVSPCDCVCRPLDPDDLTVSLVDAILPT